MFSRKNKVFFKEKKKFWFSGFKPLPVEVDEQEESMATTIVDFSGLGRLSEDLPNDIVKGKEEKSSPSMKTVDPQETLKTSTNSKDIKVNDVDNMKFQDVVIQDLDGEIDKDHGVVVNSIEIETEQSPLDRNIHQEELSVAGDEKHDILSADEKPIEMHEKSSTLDPSSNHIIDQPSEPAKESAIINSPGTQAEDRLTPETLTTLHNEYKALFSQAKLESQKYIQSLQTRLEESNTIIKNLQDDNTMLMSELDSAGEEISGLEDRIGALQGRIGDLEGRIVELEEEVEEGVVIREEQEKELQKMEADFGRFGRRIKGLQYRIWMLEKERDELKQKLRSFQLGEEEVLPIPSNPVRMKEELDQARYDVEALKALARELESQNESLRSQSRHTQNLSFVDGLSRQSQSFGFSDGFQSPSRQSQGFNRPTASHIQSQDQRTDSKVPTPTPSDPLTDYYAQKQNLQDRLTTLAAQKNKLLWELSRLKPGPKSLLRGGELEEELDSVEREVGKVRRQMRSLGLM